MSRQTLCRLSWWRCRALRPNRRWGSASRHPPSGLSSCAGSPWASRSSRWCQDRRVDAGHKPIRADTTDTSASAQRDSRRAATGLRSPRHWQAQCPVRDTSWPSCCPDRLCGSSWARRSAAWESWRSTRQP